MRYLGIDHIAIAVTDKDEAIAQFRDTLEMKYGGLRESPEGFYQADFDFGETSRIALVQAKEKGHAIDRAIQATGEGFYKLALVVDNLEAARSELAAKGVRLVDTERPRGPVLVHPSSAHGMMIELVERESRSPAAKGHENRNAPYRSIDHITVAVRDHDKAIATYRDKLGMKLDRVQAAEARGIKQAVFPMENGQYVILSQPTSPDSAMGRALERRGDGVHVFTVDTRDLPARVAALKANGAFVIGGEKSGDVFIHPRSAYGCLIQIEDANDKHP